MALWPFGRSKKKKNSVNDEKGNGTTAGADASARENPGHGFTPSKLSKRLSRSSRKSRRQSESKPLIRNEDSKSRERRQPDPPPPPVPALPRQAGIPDRLDKKPLTSSQPDSSRQPLSELHNGREEPPPRPFAHATTTASQTSIQPEKFTVISASRTMPTLGAKRTNDSELLPRRKSNKRKLSDRAREQEIRALNTPIPLPRRPQSFTSGLLARDTKNVPGGLNRRLQRPTSEVSLPLADSIRSSVSDMSELHHSFRVSAFGALSPRPTIRYSESPRQMVSGLGSKTSMRKDKAPAIPEEQLYAPRSRVDDFADRLDASAIREVMERDRRRQEKKKRSDHEKLQKKLQKKADAAKQEQEQGDGDIDMQDAAAGLGTAQPSSTQPEAQSGRMSPPPSREGDKVPPPVPKDVTKELPPSPDDQVPDKMRQELGTPNSDQEEPVIETAKAIRLSQANMSPPKSPAPKQHPPIASTLSNPQVPPDETRQPAVEREATDSPAPSSRLQPVETKTESETSGRKVGAWAAFFRRGTKSTKASSEKDRTTPSEFSNTSRESFARQHQPVPVVQRSYKPKGSEGTPRRTQSKFREDLPELPISPPASRVQSPDPRATSPFVDRASKLMMMDDEARSSTPMGDVHPALREHMEISRNQSVRSASPEGPEGPSSALLSQSLASVDSEGSWLSGKPAKRSSIPINSLRESATSLTQRLKEDEESSITEDRYFARREPDTGINRGPGGITSQLRQINTSAQPARNFKDSDQLDAVSPIDDEDIKYATVKGSKPNIVEQVSATKSREGLLQEYTAGEEVSPVSTESPDTPVEKFASIQDSPAIQRATSVEYGGGKGHVRRVSAGSARLLDIVPRRGSVDQRRLSAQSSVAQTPDRRPSIEPQTPLKEAHAAPT